MGAQKVSPEVLRERLANERTLLAWLRTALAFIGLGLVVARFAWLARVGGFTDQQSEDARWIGFFLIVLGALMSGVGVQRMRAYDRCINPSGGGPGNHVLYGTALSVVVLAIVLAAQIVLA